MFVLHLPPSVLDGMNGAAKEHSGGRWGRREVLMPQEGSIDQLVKEDTLNCFRLQYCQTIT